jgi:hypothetical protein
MLISDPDRLRIRPKVSDPYGSGSGSGSATLNFKIRKGKTKFRKSCLNRLQDFVDENKREKNSK